MSKFCVPMKVKKVYFKKCDECSKRKLITILYDIYDQGLNSRITAYVCKKCMKEAKQRAKDNRELGKKLIEFLKEHLDCSIDDDNFELIKEFFDI